MTDTLITPAHAAELEAWFAGVDALPAGMVSTGCDGTAALRVWKLLPSDAKLETAKHHLEEFYRIGLFCEKDNVTLITYMQHLNLKRTAYPEGW